LVLEIVGVLPYVDTQHGTRAKFQRRWAVPPIASAARDVLSRRWRAHVSDAEHVTFIAIASSPSPGSGVAQERVSSDITRQVAASSMFPRGEWVGALPLSRISSAATIYLEFATLTPAARF